MTTTTPARKRRPGMTKEKFLDEVCAMNTGGIHFVMGYVAHHIPAWIRLAAVVAAKENGHGK